MASSSRQGGSSRAMKTNSSQQDLNKLADSQMLGPSIYHELQRVALSKSDIVTTFDLSDGRLHEAEPGLDLPTFQTLGVIDTVAPVLPQCPLTKKIFLPEGFPCPIDSLPNVDAIIGGVNQHHQEHVRAAYRSFVGNMYGYLLTVPRMRNEDPEVRQRAVKNAVKAWYKNFEIVARYHHSKATAWINDQFDTYQEKHLALLTAMLTETNMDFLRGSQQHDLWQNHITWEAQKWHLQMLDQWKEALKQERLRRIKLYDNRWFLETDTLVYDLESLDALPYIDLNITKTRS